MHRLEHLVAHTLDSAHVWVERRGDVGVIRLLHRAPPPATHCVLCAPMRGAIWRALHQLEHDDACRVILFTSDSARVFAQGPCCTNVKEALHHSPIRPDPQEEPLARRSHRYDNVDGCHYIPSLTELTCAIEQSAKTTVAVVEGLCVSWGMELALAARWCVAVTSMRGVPAHAHVDTDAQKILTAPQQQRQDENDSCDSLHVNRHGAMNVTPDTLTQNCDAGRNCDTAQRDTGDVIHEEDTTCFCFPEAKLQVVTCAGAASRLVRRVGVRRALDLLMSGRPVGAHEAYAMHLIDAVLVRTPPPTSSHSYTCVGIACAAVIPCRDRAGAATAADATMAYTMMLTQVIPRLRRCLALRDTAHRLIYAASGEVTAQAAESDHDMSGELGTPDATHTQTNRTAPTGGCETGAVAAGGVWWKRPFQSLYLAWVRHGCRATHNRSAARGALYAVDSVALALRQSSALRACVGHHSDNEVKELTCDTDNNQHAHEQQGSHGQLSLWPSALYKQMEEEQSLFRACAARPAAVCAHYICAAAQDLTRWRDAMAQRACPIVQESWHTHMKGNRLGSNDSITKCSASHDHVDDTNAVCMVRQSVVCLTPPALWTPRRVVLLVRAEGDDRARWAQLLRCRWPTSTSVTVLYTTPDGLWCQDKEESSERHRRHVEQDSSMHRAPPSQPPDAMVVAHAGESKAEGMMPLSSDAIARVLCEADAVFDCADVMARALQCAEPHCEALIHMAQRVCASWCLYLCVSGSCGGVIAAAAAAAQGEVSASAACASAMELRTGRLRVLAMQWSTPHWDSPLVEVFIPPTHAHRSVSNREEENDDDANNNDHNRRTLSVTMAAHCRDGAALAASASAAHDGIVPMGVAASTRFEDAYMGDGATLARAMAVLQLLRKQVVRIASPPPAPHPSLPRPLSIGTPSLLWRMLLAGLFQVYSLLMDGCYPHEIDRALRERACMERGLLALEDALGLDVVAQARETMARMWSHADAANGGSPVNEKEGQGGGMCAEEGHAGMFANTDKARVANTVGGGCGAVDDARAAKIVYNLHDPDNQFSEPPRATHQCDHFYYLRLSHMAYDVWRAQVQAQRIGCRVGHGWYRYAHRGPAADITSAPLSTGGDAVLQQWNPMMWSRVAAVHYNADCSARLSSQSDAGCARNAQHSDTVDACVRHCSAARGIYRRDCSDKEVSERVMLAMLHEACGALERGEVRGARDVDVLAVMGLGLPAHRGGLCGWIDHVMGIDQAVRRMRIYHRAFGPGVFPAPSAVMLTIQRDKSTFGQVFATPTC